MINELEEYDKIILHLGAKKVFRKGSAFYYRTSQENLQLFCSQLKKRDKEVYLWFLDSYGDEGFLELYENYQKNNFVPAVSLEQGIVLQRKDKLFFIKTARKLSHKDLLKKDYTRQTKYYTVTGYTIKKGFTIKRNDDIVEKITRKDKIHFLKLNRKALIKKDDYVGEYFMIKSI